MHDRLGALLRLGTFTSFAKSGLGEPAPAGRQPVERVSMTMPQDNMPQVKQYWNDIAHQFDAIYTGKKSFVARRLDRWLRRDIYQRFDWVMEQAGNVRGQRICDLGCGSGRFVAELAKARRHARHRRRHRTGDAQDRKRPGHRRRRRRSTAVS